MTSREKLLQLRHDFYTNSSLDYDSISYFTSIEKDLEALEILKKYMWFSFHKELGFQVFCNDTIDLGNEEEFNLLKERLENDK